ncbi:MAG: hypothetical protein FJW83_05400 [Actinobacteria bacterium]|nr:hypothetical protein [Actinomycetota bacterium]
MTTIALVACASVAWLGLALLLDSVPLFRRRSLTDRLRRYAADPHVARRADGPVGIGALEALVGPWRAPLGCVRTAFATTPLAVRLARAGRPGDVAGFRRRQASGAFALVVLTVLLVAAGGAPPWASLVLLGGAPFVGAAVPGLLLDRCAADRREQLFHELPVVVEHLGALIGNGFSVGAAVQRLARRTEGVAAEDLARVANRVRQGTAERDALEEWARLSGLPEVRRLAAVLALDQQGVDLDRLLALEAEAARQEAHRRAVETIDRRTQLVWIPVTVAALLPGMLLLAVPFLAALADLSVP